MALVPFVCPDHGLVLEALSTADIYCRRCQRWFEHRDGETRRIDWRRRRG